MNSFNSLRNLSLGAIFFIRRDSFLLPTRGVEVFGDLWKIAHAASFCRKSKTLPGFGWGQAACHYREGDKFSGLGSERAL